MLLSLGHGLMNAFDRPPGAALAFMHLVGFWVLPAP